LTNPAATARPPSPLHPFRSHRRRCAHPVGERRRRPSGQDAPPKGRGADRGRASQFPGRATRTQPSTTTS